MDIALDESREKLDEHKKKIKHSIKKDDDGPIREMTEQMFDDIDNKFDVLLFTVTKYTDHPDKSVRKFVKDLTEEIDATRDWLTGHYQEVKENDDEADYKSIDKKLWKLKLILADEVDFDDGE